MARASDSARWLGVVVAWKTRARVASLTFGTSSRSKVRRASTAVSSTSKRGHGMPSSRLKYLRNPVSNGALCATSTVPRANSRKLGSTWAMRGLSMTMASVMPVSTVMNAGMVSSGLTSVWNSPSTSPPRTFTAPTSVIFEPALAEPPVVSRSTTQNVTSDSGRPRSSNEVCTASTHRTLVRSSDTGVTGVTGVSVGRPV